MSIWFRGNGFKFNCDKTQIVKFKTSKSNEEQDLSVQAGGKNINSFSSANFLKLEAFIQILSNKLN